MLLQTKESQLNSAFVLAPPEIIKPITPDAVAGVTPLPDSVKAGIDTRVNAFVNTLMSEDVQSDKFREKLDQSFSLGRTEIAAATGLTSDFTKNYTTEIDSPAYKAISEMRTLFDDLNPARQGDLFAPNKVFGITVPFGSKLTAYLRRYEKSGKQISALYEHIEDAKTEVEKSVSDLGVTRTKLYEGIQKLESVVYFMNRLDERLTAEVDMLRLQDATRAKAFEQEVLYYARQNLGDVQAAQALTINAYNVAEQLRRTGREVIIGCDRLATLGMSALEVAVMLAKATGVQIKTMEMLVGAKKTVEDLITASGDALNRHVQATVEFGSNPIFGVQKLQEMFSQTDAAIDMMANYRSTALNTMKSNNQMVQNMLNSQNLRINNERAAAGLPA
jgi:uncharacterized protein YaaN involved in tellurite resistance